MELTRNRVIERFGGCPVGLLDRRRKENQEVIPEQSILYSVANTFLGGPMCGIVGYIGRERSIPVLMDGLEKLEYRGYDSAGIAYLDNEHLTVQKSVGKLENLRKILIQAGDEGVGIGHTRWATHGAPTEKNAHPHMSANHKIAVVHNGIIENYLKLKEQLAWLGYDNFQSETDTEVIAHLIEYHYFQTNDLLKAVQAATEQMEGAYAIAVLASDRPDELIAVRKDSPLIVGLGEGENFLASDVPAILKHTRKVQYLENDEFVHLTRDKVTIYDSNLHEVQREIAEIDWDITSAEKDGYDTFTLKEIFEQPKSLKDTISHRVKNGVIDFELELSPEDIQAIDRIYIVACGTAYHAGLIGKAAIEKLAGIPVQVEIASEFHNSQQFVNPNSLVMAISQSGETIDTLKAIRSAKQSGAKIISILNVVGSSIARESDQVLYTWAGPEIGVASTKAYTTQLASLYLFAMTLAQARGQMVEADLLTAIESLPELVQQTLQVAEQVKGVAESQFENEKIMFLGRGIDYYTALEASLKLKEISYINCLAIPAGELKHGTIALVEPGTWVVAFLTQDSLADKMVSNLKEVKARGAKVMVITSLNKPELKDVAEDIIVVPQTKELIAPLLTIIPGQLLAYYMASARGHDVDQPRNLAKSVTVE